LESPREIDLENAILNEIQLLLEEKRTSLATMRTGIAVVVAQLLVLSILIATSKHYQFIEIMHLTIPFLIINGALFFLACYLVIRSLVRLHHCDRIILKLKAKNKRIAELVA
jgi:hypothetical protein